MNKKNIIIIFLSNMKKKRIMNSFMSHSSCQKGAFCMLLIGAMALSSCKQDLYENQPKPEEPTPGAPAVVTDAERVAYAEKVLGVTIDKEQDWSLTNEYSITIKADADLDNISAVAVLDANPYAGESNCLAKATPSATDSLATIKFRAPKSTDLFYAACLTQSGECVARAFVPGQDSEVSFVYSHENVRKAPGARRLSPVEKEAKEDLYYMRDFYTFRTLLNRVLPKGQDNRAVVGKHNYTNAVKVRKNPYSINALPIAYVGGNSESTTSLGYDWLPQNDENGSASFVIYDKYPKGWDFFNYLDETRQFELHGHLLYCRDLNKNEDSHVFTPGDVVKFKVVKDSVVLEDDGGERVKVFQLNQNVVVACEDGNDWDYNDRVFWMPEGVVRIQEITEPVPSVPQVWTYVWEDQDFGDYDLNDCVIEVRENADDASKLDISLVALGANNNLWLYFDSKTQQNFRKLTKVFQDELHKVLGAKEGSMVNTGQDSAQPITITVSKPADFDFQTCSFVLVSEVNGLFNSVKISVKGQDPHGIVVPGKWQWPTEKTCIKDAYPEFNTWAADHTKARDWYKHPVEGKVVKNK